MSLPHQFPHAFVVVDGDVMPREGCAVIFGPVLSAFCASPSNASDSWAVNAGDVADLGPGGGHCHQACSSIPQHTPHQRYVIRTGHSPRIQSCSQSGIQDTSLKRQGSLERTILDQLPAKNSSRIPVNHEVAAVADYVGAEIYAGN